MSASIARRLGFSACLTWLLVAPLWAAQGAGGVDAPTVVEDPLERRVLEIAKDLRCAVCQNQPVSESNADLARDMRAIIREQLAAGKSRDEIVDYFVARYGDYVLLKPPFDPAGALIWVAPPLVFVVLGISAWVFIRRRMRQAPPPVPTLSEEDLARVRAARQQD